MKACRSSVGNREKEVVVQVFPNARKVQFHLDAVFAQVLGRPDAGEHQDLR